MRFFLIATFRVLAVAVMISTVTAKCPGAVETYSNLSTGKFYKYSVAPSSPYNDNYAVAGYSDGSKLTNETADSSEGPEWVGWQGVQSLEIILDLGKIRPIDEIKLQALSATSIGIYFPASITIFTRQTASDAWIQYGGTINYPQDTNSLSFRWIGHSDTNAFGRYIKIAADAQIGQWMVFEELIVNGIIHNARRYVPAYGCYHGAYPVNSLGYLTISAFETLAQKQLSVVLWYHGMALSGGDCNFVKIGNLYSSSLGKNYSGYRFLSIGWLPEITANQIANGQLDAYFVKWFNDSINPSLRNGCIDPIWIRPMNEMNSGWVSYGLDPLNYRRAWRRMYNIAEQIGATDMHIFVWSPNWRSYPDEAWNKMEKYYPGDQYVDWVGASVYPPSWAEWYPAQVMTEFYNLYHNRKPTMISEGGFGDSVDRERWIREMYDCPRTTFPDLKLIIYENHNNRVIDYNEATLAAYQQSVSDPFFLDKPASGRVDLNYDGIVNNLDFAVFSQQWLFSDDEMNMAGDIYQDREVDISDLSIMCQHWLDD